jgi:hypothetical protein
LICCTFLEYPNWVLNLKLLLKLVCPKTLWDLRNRRPEEEDDGSQKKKTDEEVEKLTRVKQWHSATAAAAADDDDAKTAIVTAALLLLLLLLLLLSLTKNPTHFNNSFETLVLFATPCKSLSLTKP